jgi:DUF3102 family protein
MKKIMRSIKLIATDLQAALQREAANSITIGGLLIEAQAQLDYGEWLAWLKKHFGSTDRTTENYMNAARFAARFEIVSKLKLRPSALYRLGRELEKPTGRYNHKAIEAILKAAETKWVNADETKAIAKSLQPPKIQEAIPTKAQASAEKVEALVELVFRDVIFPSFDQTVTTLAHLQTKPLDSFVATTHAPDRIRAVSIFLQEVANAIEQRRKPAIAGHEPRVIPISDFENG